MLSTFNISKSKIIGIIIIFRLFPEELSISLLQVDDMVSIPIHLILIPLLKANILVLVYWIANDHSSIDLAIIRSSVWPTLWLVWLLDNTDLVTIFLNWSVQRGPVPAEQNYLLYLSGYFAGSHRYYLWKCKTKKLGLFWMCHWRPYMASYWTRPRVRFLKHPK